ncbi:hypothetical protein QAD02_015530, partial [Eretmocerus hayati]
SGQVKRRSSIGEVELQEIELDPDSGGGGSDGGCCEGESSERRSASTHDVETALKDDNETCAVQTVDLVAGCPRSAAQIKTNDPNLDCDAIIRLPSPTPSGTSSANSMGQRPSSVSLLRPKISLTLRTTKNDKNNNNSSSRTSKSTRHTSPPAKLNNQHQIIVELHREKETNNFDIIRCKERDKENIDRLDKHERNAATIQRLERSDKTDQYTEKDISETICADSGIEKMIDRNCQIIRESKESKEKVKRAISEPNLMNQEQNCGASGRDKHRHRRTKRNHRPKTPSTFGIEIADLDSFLTKASIERPANIPVVLSQSSTLYQTAGGQQAELALPLGTVLNAVFKNQAWLYVQTAHGHEGYVGCESCLPLGVPSPPRDTCSSSGPSGTSSSISSSGRQRASPPCWEDSTDLFPRPLGNQSDPDRLRDTRSECGHRHRSQSRTAVELHRNQQSPTETGNRGLGDRLFLRASTANPRQRLLLVRDDYEAESSDALTVNQGQLIYLVATAEYGTAAGRFDDEISNMRSPDWLWVRDRQGREGLVPTRVAARALL